MCKYIKTDESVLSRVISYRTILFYQLRFFVAFYTVCDVFFIKKKKYITKKMEVMELLDLRRAFLPSEDRYACPHAEAMRVSEF